LENSETRFAECLRLLEETGDVDRCLQLYPDLGRQLREHLAATSHLSSLAPPSPPPELQNSGRRLLLSSLSRIPEGIPMWKRVLSNKAAALAAAGTLFVLGTVGAGAATGSPFTEPVNDVLDNLGLGADHGQTVSEDGHKAKADAVENGDKVGPAVSEAACEAAHDKETLPEGAQAAPGHNKDQEKDCTHPSNADEEEPEDDPQGDEQQSEQDEPKNHGDAVSNAAQDAKAEAVENGDKVGPAVSEAACEAAHDKETLPEGAQQANGHNKDQEKDCTHPSNAPANENSQGNADHGKDSAPGQQKKPKN
jgi:hypothetical protein